MARVDWRNMSLSKTLTAEGYRPSPKNVHVRVAPGTCVVTPQRPVFVTEDTVWVGPTGGRSIHRALCIANLFDTQVRGLTN